MNKQNLKGYESPKIDVFELRVEGVVCESPNYGAIGAAGAFSNYNDYGADF